jgi:hypothetical protein
LFCKKNLKRLLGWIIGVFAWVFVAPFFEPVRTILIATVYHLPQPSAETIVLGIIGIGIIVVGSILIIQDVRNYFKTRGSFPQQDQDLERIGEVQAHLFFPASTLETQKTLDYHKEHFHHRLFVNHKTAPPSAYYLPTDGFGWKLISKYPDLWVSETDPNPYDDSFTAKWCQEKGYQLFPVRVEKEDLLRKIEVASELTPQQKAELELKKEQIRQEAEVKKTEIFYASQKSPAAVASEIITGGRERKKVYLGIITDLENCMNTRPLTKEQRETYTEIVRRIREMQDKDG